MTAPVRIGLIGAGRWGRVYLRNLDALAGRAQLTHLCTSRADAADLVGPRVEVVREWAALVDGPCDAVIIATPPHTHAPILEHCLRARKPCIVEKPLCLDVATADRLDDAVRASGVAVLVDHTHLFHPAYAALKHALRQGGEPIRVVISEGMAMGPFRSHTTALWDWGPHDVSLCLDLLGASPVRIAALPGPGSQGAGAELISIRLDWSEGASAWIHTGRLSPQKRRNLTVITDRHLYQLDDVPTSSLTVANIELESRYAGGLPETLERRLIPFDDRPPLACMLERFVDGITGQRLDGFGTALGRDVVRVIAECERELTRRGPAAATRAA